MWKTADPSDLFNVLIYWALSHYIHSIENTFRYDTYIQKVPACQWKQKPIKFKACAKNRNTFSSLLVAIQIFLTYQHTHYKNIFILYWKWKSVNVFWLSHQCFFMYSHISVFYILLSIWHSTLSTVIRRASFKIWAEFFTLWEFFLKNKSPTLPVS